MVDIDEKTHHYLYRKIYTDLKTPEHWLSDGYTKEPNLISKRNAMIACKKLYNFLKKPTVIAATVESGIYISYKLPNHSISIETYNDGDVVALINDDINKNILFSLDIKDCYFCEFICNILLLKLSEERKKWD